MRPTAPATSINPVYQETAYGLVGIGGESRSGDANGQYIRVGAGGGTNTVLRRRPGRRSHPVPARGDGAGPRPEDAVSAPTFPARPRSTPDMRSEVGPAPSQSSGSGQTILESAPNSRQAEISREAVQLYSKLALANSAAAAVDSRSERRRYLAEYGDLTANLQRFTARTARVRAPAAGAGRLMTAIRKHLRDFIAVAGLTVLALFVTYVLLQKQRLRIPILEEKPFELKAEFETAQAITPGQGQTVVVAGVKIGDISKVELVDGKAVVTMDIERALPADLPQRDRAGTAPDRPPGHLRRARPRQQERRRVRGRRHGADREHRSRRSTSTRCWRRSTATRRPTCGRSSSAAARA